MVPMTVPCVFVCSVIQRFGVCGIWGQKLLQRCSHDCSCLCGPDITGDSCYVNTNRFVAQVIQLIETIIMLQLQCVATLIFVRT